MLETWGVSKVRGGSKMWILLLLPWAFCDAACCSLIFRSIAAPAVASSDPGCDLVSNSSFRLVSLALLNLVVL